MQPKFKSQLLEAVEVFREDVSNYELAYEMVIYFHGFWKMLLKIISSYFVSYYIHPQHKGSEKGNSFNFKLQLFAVLSGLYSSEQKQLCCCPT